jgi:hypothetical protein
MAPGEIAAHGCAVPSRFLHAGGSALMVCVVDWAASKALPGGGALVYHHIGKLADGLIGVGGSDDAQRVLPRMGFKVLQQLDTSARVLRPLGHFLSTPNRTWKDAAKLARNLWRHATGAHTPVGPWRKRRVEQFDATAPLPQPGLVSPAVCYRDAALLNYYLACPAARMEGYLLERDGVPAGYLILAAIQGDCRIADLWVQSPDPADWAAALELACAGRPENRISVAGIAASGFHLIGRQPVFVKDPRRSFPPDLHVALAMADNDAFYLPG